MRRRIAAVAAAMIFAFCGCGGVRILGIVNASPEPLWAAQIAQPTQTIVIIPNGTTLLIIIQLVNYNGGFVSAPVFLNGFDSANPGFPQCSNVANVFNGGLIAAPAGLPQVPTIGLTLSPFAPGTCTLPLNLGQSGVVPLSITVR